MGLSEFPASFPASSRKLQTDVVVPLSEKRNSNVGRMLAVDERV